jgi:hypothetical protein
VCDDGAAEELDAFETLHHLNLIVPHDEPQGDPLAERASLRCGCIVTYQATGSKMWARRPCGHVARSHPSDAQVCDGCSCCVWNPADRGGRAESEAS